MYMLGFLVGVTGCLSIMTFAILFKFASEESSLWFLAFGVTCFFLAYIEERAFKPWRITKKSKPSIKEKHSKASRK